MTRVSYQYVFLETGCRQVPPYLSINGEADLAAFGIRDDSERDSGFSLKPGGIPLTHTVNGEVYPFAFVNVSSADDEVSSLNPSALPRPLKAGKSGLHLLVVYLKICPAPLAMGKHGSTLDATIGTKSKDGNIKSSGQPGAAFFDVVPVNPADNPVTLRAQILQTGFLYPATVAKVIAHETLNGGTFQGWSVVAIPAGSPGVTAEPTASGQAIVTPPGSCFKAVAQYL